MYRRFGILSSRAFHRPSANDIDDVETLWHQGRRELELQAADDAKKDAKRKLDHARREFDSDSWLSTKIREAGRLVEIPTIPFREKRLMEATDAARAADRADTEARVAMKERLDKIHDDLDVRWRKGVEKKKAAWKEAERKEAERKEAIEKTGAPESARGDT